jgi:opacity protein-like surface antigen
MNRKGLLVLVLTVVAAGSAFAQPELKLSAGGGGFFASDFGGGFKINVTETTELEVKTPYAGGGAWVFFDAAFAELSLGFFAAGGNHKAYNNGTQYANADMSYAGLDIGLLGKYPFAPGERVTLFPLLGIAYRHFISVKTGGVKQDPGDWSALWFKLGGGADYAVTGHIYARLSVLYGIRLANSGENYIVSFGNGDTLRGHGLDIKLAVGYTF